MYKKIKSKEYLLIIYKKNITCISQYKTYNKDKNDIILRVFKV